VSDRLAKDFVGMPIPAAAGAVASLVLVILEHELPRPLALAILVFVLLVAFLMVSAIRYPSFKQVDWSTKTRLRSFFGVILLLIAVLYLREIALVLIFLAYTGFGLVRHIRLQIQRRAYRRLLRLARAQQLVSKPSGGGE
jgi:CDP-diacylglycerol--serine O-phosphatidyltransferase